MSRPSTYCIIVIACVIILYSENPHAWEALMQSLPWCDRSHTLGARLVWGECMLCVVPPPFHHHIIEVVVSNSKKWVTGKREFLRDYSLHFKFSRHTEPHWCEHLKTCSNPVWGRILVGQMWRPRYTFTHVCRSELWNTQMRRGMYSKYLHILSISCGTHTRDGACDTHFCRSVLWNPQRRRRMCFAQI